MLYFGIFFQKIKKPWVNLLRFGRKTQIVGKFWTFLMKILWKNLIFYFYLGKIVTKNRAFGNNTFFLQQFVRFLGGGGRISPPPPFDCQGKQFISRIQYFSATVCMKDIENKYVNEWVIKTLENCSGIRLNARNSWQINDPTGVRWAGLRHMGIARILVPGELLWGSALWGSGAGEFSKIFKKFLKNIANSSVFWFIFQRISQSMR